MPDLTCPKCQSPMRSYERSGLTIDQCTGCRGVFLDRGELERLVDAEGDYYAGREGATAQPAPPQPAPPQPAPPQPAPYVEPYLERREHYGYGGGYHHHGKRRHRREGFLGEMFDFD